jgi:pilus assembly protein CpaC
MNILRSGAASAVALLMLTVAPGPLMSVAAAQDVTKVASGHTLAIQVNQGQLVRIDKPVTSVFVANSAIADVAIKSPQLIYVFAKRPGTTTLYAVGANDEILASVTLNVTHNLSRLDQAIAELMPGRNIATTSIDGGIVLTGMVSSPGEAEDARRLAAHFIGQNEEVINRLQISAPNQVNVRVRIAEVNKSVLRNLGINWDAAIQEGGFAFGLLTTFPFGLSNVLAGSTGGSTAGGAGGGAGQTVHAGPLDLTATMDLLAQEGLVSLLAEPNLTAVSGQTANFLAGGEFPVPVSQSNSSGTSAAITIEFRQFGVSLAFTPTILSANRISMRVRPEVSALSDQGAVNANGFTIPSLTVRRAETTVELASGQTFAIAGLVQSQNSITANEVPGLGDIPVLGELFKSDKFQHNESELVILATPYVVQPISNPAAPAIPTEPTMAPEGSQRVAGSPSNTAGSSGVSGQAGFVIE